MKTISTHIFKYTLRDIHKNTDNRKFCFVLGAGASLKSGIRTGGELSQQWFLEIKERIDDTELNRWMQEKNINEVDLASSYGDIYRKRFENDKTSGYEFLVQAMKFATPSFGHIVLGQILSRSAGHCVLTTNFDSLVESAVYQFTNKTPLVCGHESLSGYARPSKTHPLIIKIHRDLLLAPKSDPEEINKLDPGWKEPLDHIFSTHIPIVIGYGGNDGSLMSYFEEMNKPSNFFWCGLDENNISERIRTLIEQHDGIFVKIDGFDELMYQLLWVFNEIKPFKVELNEITSDRIQIATRQLDEISVLQITKRKKAINPNDKKELSAFEYSSLAEKEPDLNKRKLIYLEALDKYPTTDWLWYEFVYFLHEEKKDWEELGAYYQKAIELGHEGSQFLNNYGIYFELIRNDADKAEEYFIKSIGADPKNASACSTYAHFLKVKRKKISEAENYYLKALEIEPNDSIPNGNYAQLLLEKGKTEVAEKYLDRAFGSSEINDLLVELWFYRYAHFSKFLLEAENKIEELLSKGIRSIGWDFEGNIVEAIKQGHPNPEKLKEFARRISTE